MALIYFTLLVLAHVAVAEALLFFLMWVDRKAGFERSFGSRRARVLLAAGAVLVVVGALLSLLCLTWVLWLRR